MGQGAIFQKLCRALRPSEEAEITCPPKEGGGLEALFVDGTSQKGTTDTAMGPGPGRGLDCPSLNQVQGATCAADGARIRTEG